METAVLLRQTAGTHPQGTDSLTQGGLRPLRIETAQRTQQSILENHRFVGLPFRRFPALADLRPGRRPISGQTKLLEHGLLQIIFQNRHEKSSSLTAAWFRSPISPAVSTLCEQTQTPAPVPPQATRASFPWDARRLRQQHRLFPASRSSAPSSSGGRTARRRRHREAREAAPAYPSPYHATAEAPPEIPSLSQIRALFRRHLVAEIQSTCFISLPSLFCSLVSSRKKRKPFQGCEKFFSLSPCVFSSDSFLLVVSQINFRDRKNILRQKGSGASLPFWHAEKRGVFRRFAPEHRQNRVHISLFFGENLKEPAQHGIIPVRVVRIHPLFHIRGCALLLSHPVPLTGTETCKLFTCQGSFVSQPVPLTGTETREILNLSAFRSSRNSFPSRGQKPLIDRKLPAALLGHNSFPSRGQKRIPLDLETLITHVATRSPHGDRN